jgi:flagellar hook assembly protein FlgD
VAGALEVHLFDLEGRRVRRLLDRADAPAGVQRLDFDGRGDDGTPLRSGMYFYRVRASEGETAGRFLVVR